MKEKGKNKNLRICHLTEEEEEYVTHCRMVVCLCGVPSIAMWITGEILSTKLN